MRPDNGGGKASGALQADGVSHPSMVNRCCDAACGTLATPELTPKHLVKIALTVEGGFGSLTWHPKTNGAEATLELREGQ